MRQLKVWGGRYLIEMVSGRRIVAAYTKKQACELAEISYGELTNYWSETGNAEELQLASEVGVWQTTRPWKKDEYVRVK